MITMLEYLGIHKGPFRWLEADEIRRDKKELKTNCPNCRAPVYRNMMKCEYCGTKNKEDPQ